MIFYNQNPEQDRRFLELQTKLNLSYWISADLDHYYQSSKENINTYQYKKLLEQRRISLDIINSINIGSENIGFNAKACLFALKKFVEGCIKFSDFTDTTKNTDSESEEINILHMNSIEKEFHDVYLDHLHPNEMESYMLRSFSSFGAGLEAIMQFMSEIEFNDDKKLVSLSDQISNDFILTRSFLDKALKDPNTLEFLLDELTIITGGKLLQKDVEEFYDLNLNFTRLFKEYVMVYERYCNNLLNNEQEDENDSDLLEFESNNYLGFINVLAIKMHLFILKKMNISIPKLEIFSQRVIKSPIDYIQNRHL